MVLMIELLGIPITRLELQITVVSIIIIWVCISMKIGEYLKTR